MTGAGFIDTHCHILPGLDDGPSSLQGSLAMARLYAKHGVRRLIATPHFIVGTAWDTPAQRVVHAVQALQQQLIHHHIELTLYPGMEIASSARIPKLFEQGLLLPLAGSSAYLLEPAFLGGQEALVLCINFFLSHGYTPIIAHPERIAFFQEHPKILYQLVEQGARLQLTLDSLLAPPRSRRYQLAHLLIRTGQVHYLASDAHAHNTRPPPDAQLWQDLAALLDSTTLQTLCIEHPAALLDHP